MFSIILIRFVIKVNLHVADICQFVHSKHASKEIVLMCSL